MSAYFWFIAGTLVGVTATVVAVPLWRASARSPERGALRYVIPAGAVATFAVAAVVIYLTIGAPRAIDGRNTAVVPPHPIATTRASDGAPPQSMEAAAAQLAARLARDGGSAADWDLLAKSYDFLGRPDDAQRARARAAGSPASAAAPAPGPVTAPAEALSPKSVAMLASQMAPAGVSATADDSKTLSELERRVRANPRDTQALLDLAGLHRRQRDYAKARDVFTKVVALNGMNAEAWADYADVLASLAGGSLGGEAARAIDHALALDPANAKALWLKASRAHEEHRYADALALWKTLRAALPPDSPDARIVDANIAEASQLAGVPAPQTAQTAKIAATGPTASELAGTVSIDSRFAARVEHDATLFIYAKAADSPGPPLAVIRTTAGAWPVSFRLDDSMAMIPSRRLSQFDKVVVEARVSKSGQATPAPGDLYVTSAVLKPSDRKKIALVINREIG
jgi:cytochrome c-type biogenesis protein CcmH